jgi:menaquinone-dependent protoporphyrinogen oxidase
MARVLILYGTTDGHTRKIATALREALVDEGVYAFVSDARYGTESVVAEEYDGVIVAASIHAGGFQRPVTRWVRKQAAELNRMPTAFPNWTDLRVFAQAFGRSLERETVRPLSEELV